MSHYVDQKTARKKDFMAIEKILDMDPEGLYETVEKEKISMCGFQPTVSAMAASKELGASKATLVKYQTSGDVTGDHAEVVGYAGIRIT
jgi:AmmeMemoRadiSam system protein B